MKIQKLKQDWFQYVSISALLGTPSMIGRRACRYSERDREREREREREGERAREGGREGGRARAVWVQLHLEVFRNLQEACTLL